jgi:hypothetical protein
MKILSFLLLFLAFYSCSVIRVSNVIDVAEYNQNKQKILIQAEIGIQRVEIDLFEHEKILIKWGDDKSRQSLFRMRSVQRNLLQNYVRLKEDFENYPFRHKDKISTQDNDYQSFNDTQKDFEKRFDILDKQFDKYRSESLGLNAYLESKSVFRVNSKKMKDDFVSSLNEAKGAQLKVKNELMDLNMKLSDTSIEPEKHKEQKMIILELVKIVEKMENETFKLQRLFNASMKEINSGVKFATPGMKAHNYVNKIQNHMDFIQAQSVEFNFKSKSLNY